MITTRNNTPEFTEFYRQVSRGDLEAFQWLMAWHEYTHEIDDLVDLFLPGPELLMQTLAHAIDLYSLPFYQKHTCALQGVAKTITGTYLISVQWEHADDKWKRTCADILRHAGNDMIYAVAEVVGGWSWRIKTAAILSDRVIQDRNEPEV